MTKRLILVPAIALVAACGGGGEEGTAEGGVDTMGAAGTTTGTSTGTYTDPAATTTPMDTAMGGAGTTGTGTMGDTGTMGGTTGGTGTTGTGGTGTTGNTP